MHKRNGRVFPCTLRRVIDGDTLEVIADLGFTVQARVAVRLCDIDAPERTTEDGKIAAAWLTEFLKDTKALAVTCYGRDKYGRWVADVVPDDAPLTLSESAVIAGHAARVIY